MEGLKYGSMYGAAGLLAVLAANRYSPTFRSSLGVSGKTALVVSSVRAQPSNCI